MNNNNSNRGRRAPVKRRVSLAGRKTPYYFPILIQLVQRASKVALFSIGGQPHLYCYEIFPKAGHPYLLAISGKSSTAKVNFLKHLGGETHGREPVLYPGDVKKNSLVPYCPKKYYLAWELDEYKQAHDAGFEQHIFVPAMYDGLIKSQTWINSVGDNVKGLKLSLLHLHMYCINNVFVFVCNI